MANVIQIIVETVDRTGGVFGEVLSSLGLSDEKIKSINEKLPAIVTGFTMAGAAIGAAVAYTKEAVKETIAYGEEIENITRLTGQTAEEASRLYQVAQNIGISYKELSTALETATKKGVDTSIESLLTLADEYNSLQSPIERAKLLTDTFGASGLNMGALFEQGSAKIIAAMEGVNQALVLNEAALAGLDQYEQSVNELKGAFESLKITVGLNVIPTLQALLNVLNNEEGWRAGGFERMFGKIKTDAWSATNAINSLISAIRTLLSMPTGGRPDYAGGSNTGKTKYNWDTTGGGPGGANGLDFTVPPGYPNDSFPFRAQSGERVQVTPKSAVSGDGFDYDRLIRGFVEALERSSLVR